MELTLENNLTKNYNLTKETNIITKISHNLIENAASYIIKSLPIQENVRDLLKDVAMSLNSKDFKTILKTVVSSSIKEGLEFVGAPAYVVKDISKIANITLKGGLTQGICAGIDIISSKYLNNNILGDDIKNFVTELKNYIKGSTFLNKFNISIKKFGDKVNKVNDLFKMFDNALKEYNKNLMNSIYLSIQKMKSFFTTELSEKFKTITNIINRMNEKENERLSEIELEACSIVA